MGSLTPSERIALQAAWQIGQIERSNSSEGFGRKQHWRTIDSLERKGLLKYINHWSAILTEHGRMIADALVDNRKPIENESVKWLNCQN